MSTLSFDIIIPSHSRCEQLDITLTTISRCSLPAELGNIYVVENGGMFGARAICQKHGQNLNIEYIYLNQAGLTTARNTGIERSSAEYLIFLDNDIRPSKEAFFAYVDAFQRHGNKTFYGGPLYPDYDIRPPDWLIPLLPWSAKEHALGDKEISIDKPLFLGGNFAVSRVAFEELGMFEGPCATGRYGGGTEEETRLQRRLINAGYQGIYVPGAAVRHYVPTTECDSKFVCNRQWRSGYTKGHLLSEINRSRIILLDAPLYLWRELLDSLLGLRIFLNPFSQKADRLRRLMSLYHSKGKIDGCKKQRGA